MKFTKKVKAVAGQGVAHFTAPTIALFLVWLSTGIWHGPRWTYIFYGMYYFVLIFIENILEEPFLALLAKLKLKEE
ncbi:MAG: MBOAT family protein, partial [Lachnospiraceae bacterium]|nr:MBOAT family protein [Lachnospiraceae bacterium]